MRKKCWKILTAAADDDDDGVWSDAMRCLMSLNFSFVFSKLAQGNEWMNE